MKFTEQQADKMWKVFCATLDVPRAVGGMSPLDRLAKTKKVEEA